MFFRRRKIWKKNLRETRCWQVYSPLVCDATAIAATAADDDDDNDRFSDRRNTQSSSPLPLLWRRITASWAKASTTTTLTAATGALWGEWTATTIRATSHNSITRHLRLTLCRNFVPRPSSSCSNAQCIRYLIDFIRKRVPVPNYVRDARYVESGSSSITASVLPSEISI